MLSEDKSVRKEYSIYEERKLANNIDILDILEKLYKSTNKDKEVFEETNYMFFAKENFKADLNNLREDVKTKEIYNKLITTISNAEIVRIIND